MILKSWFSQRRHLVRSAWMAVRSFCRHLPHRLRGPFMSCWPGFQTEPRCLGQHTVKATRGNTGQGQEYLISGDLQKEPNLPQNWSQGLSPETAAQVNDVLERVWEQDRQRFMSGSAFRLDNQLLGHSFSGIGAATRVNAGVHARILRRGETRQEYWFCLSSEKSTGYFGPHAEERYRVEQSVPPGAVGTPKQMVFTHETAGFDIPKQ